MDIPFNQEGKGSLNAFEAAVEGLRNMGKQTRIETGLEAIRTSFVNGADKGNGKVGALFNDVFINTFRFCTFYFTYIQSFDLHELTHMTITKLLLFTPTGWSVM